MSPRHAEVAGKARVAIVGAESPTGTRIRVMLEERRIPGGRVELFGGAAGETVLSEYNGEARLIQDLDPGEIDSLDLVFLCEPGKAAAELAGRSAPDTVVLDLTGTSVAESGSVLVHTELEPPARQPGPGVYVVPHFLAIALAEMLAPMAAGPGLERIDATFLRPASDFGKQGVEELRVQTVNLLNFAEVPKEVFGRQLAFNCIPQHLLPPEENDLESRIGAETATLLGPLEIHTAVTLVTVPVFFGHALSLRLKPAGPLAPDEVCRLLESAGSVDLMQEDEGCTPLEVNDRRKILVSRVVPEGDGQLRVWAVLDDAGALAAGQALRLAESLCDL